MRGLVLAVVGVVLAAGLAGAADQPGPAPGPVVIDLNKLPPDVLQRLLDELAKQQQPAADKAREPVAVKDREGNGDKKPEAGKGRVGDDKNMRRPDRARGGEKPSAGRKPGDNKDKKPGDKKPDR